ncbi:MAG: type II toxin-antitoxin system VapC family toxin [Candidatus Anammoxibacter sp.]
MIIVDTGILVSLFDKDDYYHKTCKNRLAKINDQLTTTWSVLTEVMYLLNFSSISQELCLKFIESGGTDIALQDSSHIHRINQLMKKYNDLPMDFADASIVVLAEEKGITTIFTLNKKHFRLYKTKHGKSFHLIPE